MEALKRLLASQDPEEKGRAWTLPELEQRVQGSQQEVLALLKSMNALEVAPGQWRAVEEAAVGPTLDRLLTEVGGCVLVVVDWPHHHHHYRVCTCCN